jgi:colanic acid/amylovoran biosynthesis protein
LTQRGTVHSLDKHVTESPAHSRRGVQRVCILGASLDVGNRGVLALAVSLAHLVVRTVPGASLAFHYGHHEGGSKRLPGSDSTEPVDVEVLNCRLSPKSRFAEHTLVILACALLYRLGLRGPARRNRWLRSFLDADFIGEITGGDSFSDIYGFRRFLTGSLPVLTVAVLGRPFVMLPQTYGPFRLGVSRLLARFILRRAVTILTRDRNCIQLVKDLCGRMPIFCPDVAFTLDRVKPERLEFEPVGLTLDTDRPLIGMNVSGLLYMGGYTGRNMFGLRSEYAELIDRILESLLAATQATIILVPHVFGSEWEEESCAALLRSFGTRYPERVFALKGPLSERELKWVIGRTQFFVGSRMHACIAALSQCIPAVGLAYSDKFLGVFESVGVGDAIVDLRKVETPDVISRTLLAWERRAELRAELQDRILPVRQGVAATFRTYLAQATSTS